MEIDWMWLLIVFAAAVCVLTKRLDFGLFGLTLAVLYLAAELRNGKVKTKVIQLMKP